MHHTNDPVQAGDRAHERRGRPRRHVFPGLPQHKGARQILLRGGGEEGQHQLLWQPAGRDFVKFFLGFFFLRIIFNFYHIAMSKSEYYILSRRASTSWRNSTVNRSVL